MQYKITQCRVLQVVVRDLETGKTIECYVDQEITVEGKTYSLVKRATRKTRTKSQR